jgi:DNA primase
MTADHARELRRTSPLDDARALVAALGIGGRAKRTAGGLLVCCPAHVDRSPSCSVYIAEDGTVAAKCHACLWSGDALGLIAIVRGFDVRRDFRRVLDEAARLAGQGVPETSERRGAAPEVRPDDETYHAIATYLLDACPLDGAPQVAAYLDARGVYADADASGVRGFPRDAGPLVASLLATFERANLEASSVLRREHDAIDWPAWCVLVPWRDRFGRITCVQRRRLDAGEPKYRFPAGRAPRAPFGVEHLAAALDWLGPDAEIIVTEGAIDCLARRRVARHRDERAAVLGVASASTPCAGLPLDLLTGRRIVLALDDDEAGERACAALAAELSDVAGELVRERPIGPAKDWADALRGVA